eukprot:m.152135 g.152135  ORF g.152135 m.152135 type:complete len:99 (-) comp13299_c3_seq2:42-338(-)
MTHSLMHIVMQWQRVKWNGTKSNEGVCLWECLSMYIKKRGGRTVKYISIEIVLCRIPSMLCFVCCACGCLFEWLKTGCWNDLGKYCDHHFVDFIIKKC